VFEGGFMYLHVLDNKFHAATGLRI
jgi:hypothetical protein